MTVPYRTARAAVGDGKGGFAIRTIDVGRPEQGEVLVRIEAAGLCHTDWDMVHTRTEPFIMGHEGAGTVVEAGPGVTGLKPGDKVLLNWAIPCGLCPSCGRGHQSLCEVSSPANGDGVSGHGHPEAALLDGVPIPRLFFLGTMSDYAVVKQAAVTPMVDGLGFAAAAILGCGVMTGYGSVVNAAKLTAGSTAAVIGCGGVGLNVIQGCAIAGARRIVAIDIAPARLEQARSFGATHTILSQSGSLEALRAQLDPIVPGGADYAFECTAIPELCSAPLALVRHGGIAVQVSGVETIVPFDARLFEWDKTYLNPLYGMCNPARDFPILQDLYLTGALKLDELVTRIYALEELPQAFEDMLAGRLAKGVIRLAGAA